MRYHALGMTGLSVSVIGFGASPLGNVFSNISPSGDASLIGRAVDAGINIFDVSPYYGNGLAEERLGNALASNRNKVVLATKCGRYGADRFDFSAKGITKHFEESLRRLRTDFVDILQAHDIEFADIGQIVNETLPALTRLKQQGKARFVGITGYWPGLLSKVSTRYSVDTLLNYCHSNMFCDDMDRVLEETAATGTGLINASPLHMGLLGGRSIPEWHPAPSSVRAAADQVTIACQKHNVDAATLAIWMCLRNTSAATTLVGLSNRLELDSSCAALTLQPDDELLSEIHGIITPVHNLSWPQGRVENQDTTSYNELSVS